jgi:hypothetical protein
MIDADVDTAVVGDTGTGARGVFFVVDLAIGVTVSWRRDVVFRIDKINVLQKSLLSCGNCEIGSGGLCLLKNGLLHHRLRLFW